MQTMYKNFFGYINWWGGVCSGFFFFFGELSYSCPATVNPKG